MNIINELPKIKKTNIGEGNYSGTLLRYLEDNNFAELPNYPFEHSFDTIVSQGKLEDEAEDYAYHCLTNLSEVIRVNTEKVYRPNKEKEAWNSENLMFRTSEESEYLLEIDNVIKKSESITKVLMNIKNNELFTIQKEEVKDKADFTEIGHKLKLIDDILETL